jgi:hypothetical protein
MCAYTILALLLTVFVSQAAPSLSAPSPNPTCSPDLWTQPADSGGTGVQALLKDIPLQTHWADLPKTTKAQLRLLADNRLAAFRARWAADALAKKETILLGCPTSEMTAAIDDYYRKTYDTILPAGFSLKDVKSTALVHALTRGYLAAMAVYRATLTYPVGKLDNRDWNGKSLFDSIRLPDQQTFDDIKQYNAGVVRELRNVDDSMLNATEQALKQQALFAARAAAVGAFTGDSFGGEDMQTVCEIVALHSDVVMGYRHDAGRPKIFATDDEVLREVNAVFLHNTRLKWLDVGTLASALNLVLCKGTDDDLVKFVGDPGTNEVAKGMVLLRSWWVERVSASADAQSKCSIYSTQDRDQIWEAFSADQLSNNDGSSSMDSYKAQLDRYRSSMISRYRDVAKLALSSVFPDDRILSAGQRQQIVAMIDAETAFGLYSTKIMTALDAAQGTTGSPAASAWKAAISANVAMLGGNYAAGAPVRPDDEAAINAMFDQVKAWVANRYRGYPIDIASLYPAFTLTVTTDGNATTSTASGNIEFGVGVQRSKMEYYSLLIHELRHAVAGAWSATAPDKSKVVYDMGMVREGSGVAVEALLLGPFLKETLKNDLAYALYALDYGIRDARFTGTTDATLQKYFRTGCSGAKDLNTVDFTKAVGVNYGLTGPLADALALRAHVGTQYFQYVSGGVQVVDDINYLQSEIDPTGRHQIDPYVLFVCGLNNPRREATYVNALKVCMKL